MAVPSQCIQMSGKYERKDAEAQSAKLSNKKIDEIEELVGLIDTEILQSMEREGKVRTTSTMKLNLPEDPLSKPIPISRKVRVQCDQAFRKELVDLYRLYVRDQKAAERLLPILNSVTVDHSRDRQDVMAHKAINRLAIYELFIHSTDSFTRSMGLIRRGDGTPNIGDPTRSRLSEYYKSFRRPNGATTELLANVEQIAEKDVRRGINWTREHTRYLKLAIDLLCEDKVALKILRLAANPHLADTILLELGLLNREVRGGDDAQRSVGENNEGEESEGDEQDEESELDEADFI